MTAYPVLLELARQRVLVVGGGAVALRKVRGIVEADGRPDIISPEVAPELRALISSAGLVWHARGYQPGDADGYGLIFAATDKRDVNARVASDADRQGSLINVADDPDASSFQVPATLREGDVVVALATGGASPLLARRIRDRLGPIVTPGLGRAAARLQILRDEVRSRWPDDEERRRALWFQLVTSEFLDAAIAGRDEDVENRIARCLS